MISDLHSWPLICTNSREHHPGRVLPLRSKTYNLNQRHKDSGIGFLEVALMA